MKNLITLILTLIILIGCSNNYTIQDVAIIGDSLVERGDFKSISNYGIGGNTTSQVLERVRNINEKNILIWVGVNDIALDFERETSFDNYNEIANLLNDKNKEFCFILIIPVTEYTTFNSIIHQYNNYIRSNFKYIDVSGVIKKSDYVRDGVHLKKDSYDKILKEIHSSKFIKGITK